MQIIRIKTENTRLEVMQLSVLHRQKAMLQFKIMPLTSLWERVLMALMAVQRDVLEMCCTSINYECSTFLVKRSIMWKNCIKGNGFDHLGGEHLT